MIERLPRPAIVLLLALLVVARDPAALAGFEVIRVADGITLEQDDLPGRKLPILVATTTMAASPQRIAAWVSAVHTHTSWQHDCQSARVLPQPDGTRLTYNRTHSPWPVADRDVVLRSRRSVSPDGRIRIDFHSVDDPNTPVPSGVIRMAHLVGSYEMTPLAGGHTRVVYTLDSDPGGSLPGWLVRRATRDIPFYTLAGLRERAESGPPPSP